MLTWILMALIGGAMAGELDDASALLSRYPAGRVPTTSAVFEAISLLSAQGSAEHLGVLSSLQEFEQPEIRLAAEGALRIVTLRTRLERREAYLPPDSREVRRWLSEQPAPLLRADGSPMGREEQAVVAYAALVVGAIPRLTAATPEGLILEAEAQEDAAAPGAALAAYALAAAGGSQEALGHISAFGVDPERLLLGLATAPAGSLLAMPPETLELLAKAGADRTVAVLVERSTAPDELIQVKALDALAQMLQRTDLPASARRTARQRLEVAARAPDESLRAFALSALADVE